MTYLIGEIWFLLMLAFAIGAGAGVWAASARTRAAATQGVGGDGAHVIGATAPRLLFDAPDGAKDDLTQIIGIDPETEARLNALGVFHFRQIAAWEPGEARWVEIRLNAPGRIVRERWSEQAASIA